MGRIAENFGNFCAVSMCQIRLKTLHGGLVVIYSPLMLTSTTEKFLMIRLMSLVVWGLKVEAIYFGFAPKLRRFGLS